MSYEFVKNQYFRVLVNFKASMNSKLRKCQFKFSKKSFNNKTHSNTLKMRAIYPNAWV